MLKTCPKSCNSCAKAKKEKKSSAPKKQQLSVQESLEDRGLQAIQESENYGEKQKVEGEEASRVMELIASSIEYMKSDQVQTLPVKIRDICRNKHILCSFWAVIGKRIRLFLLIEWTIIILTFKFFSSFGLFRRM
jgi:hypothetical protein